MLWIFGSKPGKQIILTFPSGWGTPGVNPRAKTAGERSHDLKEEASQTGSKRITQGRFLSLFPGSGPSTRK